MRGDGHTAYGGNSSCIDAAVDAYLEDLDGPGRWDELQAGGPVRRAAGAGARTCAAKRPSVVYGGPGVKPIAR